MNSLTAISLRKSYGNQVAVQGLSLQLRHGQVCGLFGPNGAGKTTAFHMMAGLIRPDDGRVLLNNEDITDWPLALRARRGIAYLPQDPSVFRGLSVRNNLLAVLGGTRSARQRADALLSRFELEAHRDTLGAQLSGGERRRLEIARAIALTPDFLLLDEPLAGIDPIAVEGLKALIHQLRDEQGVGILITDHNIREALALCDHSWILSGGNVIAEGTAEAVALSATAREQYLGTHF